MYFLIAITYIDQEVKNDVRILAFDFVCLLGLFTVDNRDDWVMEKRKFFGKVFMHKYVSHCAYFLSHSVRCMHAVV